MHPFRDAVEAQDIEAAIALLAEDVVFRSPEGASDHALVFSARVGERKLDGCDFLHTNEHGLIDDMCVMVRPLSGALALAEAMKAELLAAQGD